MSRKHLHGIRTLSPLGGRTVTDRSGFDSAACARQSIIDVDTVTGVARKSDMDAEIVTGARVIINAGRRSGSRRIRSAISQRIEQRRIGLESEADVIHVSVKGQLFLVNRQRRVGNVADRVVINIAVVRRYDAEDVCTGITRVDPATGIVRHAAGIRRVSATDNVTCGDGGIAGIRLAVRRRSGSGSKDHRNLVTVAVISEIAEIGVVELPVCDCQSLLADCPG